MGVAIKQPVLEVLQNRASLATNTMFSLTSGFFFTSPFRSLITEGCFTKLTLPAFDGEDLQGSFQQGLQQAFSHAQAAGIEQPIICGAIPFDTTQASALFIPQQTQWFDREATLAAMVPEVTKIPQIPQVTVKKALPEQPQFMQMVAKAVQATSDNQLEKVVLARLLDMETATPLDLSALMARIINQNPDSFHFHLPLGEGEALVGASPELLLRKYADRFYSTPLAGSARRESDPQQDALIKQQLLGSGKDRYEHQIVTDGIRQQLAGRCHSVNIPASPELLRTPTLWHLSTPIDGEVADPAENALSLACLLHPTPALCGTPTQQARTLIKQLEPFDRGLFGGIVGWCDAKGNGEWVVTIRCATVNTNRVRLFAGAGIVQDSSPLAEWYETETKISTMLRAFGFC